MFITEKEKLKNYQKDHRLWQGIPGIDRTAGGRLFATFYSGGETEAPGNYVLLKKSDDDGITWGDIIAVNDPNATKRSFNALAPKRSFDPCLWIDPLGRLWWFWSQQEQENFDAIVGVWYVRCDRPDDEMLNWTETVRFANGVMMNKPTVLRNGSWLFPCAVWAPGCYDGMPEVEDSINQERFSNVYISFDEGKTISLYGSADVPRRCFDEHMILELNDGSLLMLVRTHYGIGKSYSYDGGKTWTAGEESGIAGPCSRFFIRRLKSGRILLVNHYNFKGRNNLTAMVSEDECVTLKGHLIIDERNAVSYPDGTEDDQGNIYIIYDRERGGSHEYKNHTDAAREILFAKITEEDILAGKIVSSGSRLKCIVDKL
ncbi:MAG: sialidase family protein [Saccharofermentanales bacterium]